MLKEYVATATNGNKVAIYAHTLVDAKKLAIKRMYENYWVLKTVKLSKGLRNPSLAKTGKWIKAKAVRIVGKTLQILK